MISNTQIQGIYRLYPVMAEVDPLVAEEAMADCTAVTLNRGTRVFRELEACRAFPFVLSGELRVYKQSESGRELSLYHVGAGDACIVSAGCLLGDKIYNAAGQVREDALVVMMPDRAFDLLMAQKAFRDHMFSLISKRVVGLMQLVEEVAFHRLDRRLAALLLKKGLTIRASHQELVDELGTVREMVTRVLQHFARDGLVSLGRNRIDILDRGGLDMLV